jgi:hypothetical protein
MLHSFLKEQWNFYLQRNSIVQEIIANLKFKGAIFHCLLQVLIRQARGGKRCGGKCGAEAASFTSASTVAASAAAASAAVSAAAAATSAAAACRGQSSASKCHYTVRWWTITLVLNYLATFDFF